MEGVGARLGRSLTRYGPATVFTGPVRKWKKKWIHINGAVSSNSHHISDNGSHHIKLYKWTPISQSQSQSQSERESNGDVKDDGEEEDEPPRRKIKYIPVALLEEQKKESPEEHLDESVETDANQKVDGADGKPDINDVPMEEHEVSEDTNAGRQDLNESKLDLNARDGEEMEDQER